jgi:uncharacterized membrane protein
VSRPGPDVDADRPEPAEHPALVDEPSTDIEPDPALDADPEEATVADDAEHPVADDATRTSPWRPVLGRLRQVDPATWCVWIGAAIFAVVFGRLGVQHHRNFGTWAFDMGIYDQAFWLVSRGQSFMTVRGLDVWGHHVNLIAFVFAPFYWLGAGPSFLYVVQAITLGLGAVPTYLIARDRLRSPWAATLIAYVYLMYAPVQWIAWANFHPEALVITPFLFAWWNATRRNWGWAYACVVLTLSMREDVAMALAIMGAIVWFLLRRDGDATRRDRRFALGITLLGVLWYVISVRLVIPGFNRWQQPFYITTFYGNYGSDTVEIVQTVLTRPDRVVSDATQTDRLRFYRDLLLPWGGLPLGAIGHLLMAGPQMLASVIGLSPYSRSIRFQYTSVMIAPIVIAAIEGVALAFRYRLGRRFVLPWLLVCSYVTNVAWSPSPLSPNDVVWARPDERHDAMRAALTLVPDDASVTATYALVPHLTHREQIYDWPNPWIEAYWGNDDGYRLPDPTEIEYLVLDLRHVSSDHRALVDQLTAPGGEYELLYIEDSVLVAKRPDAPAVGRPG